MSVFSSACLSETDWACECLREREKERERPNLSFGVVLEFKKKREHYRMIDERTSDSVSASKLFSQDSVSTKIDF